ncbi:flavodoxin-dependent (E)-4-hydroxy-3-methylbut-2-enyl-diphosphate synthase [Nesterenkonia pannonica]|uniref:flavodoxin-dependent (E)-4-hydroxy-3-methylbut-2-enyl-diphosphate synthase n=1 Tax=Nesterenkonia pannonica TaxID=1548602 RepID=UPI002164E4B5|nr:flavodoxin-dependent (E)-4-hydroxy-3-methylbut-2-enyl-diphosphate synthase [Nesterenkonia pannonica]
MASAPRCDRVSPAFQGTIKSSTAFGALLSQGIGDTIRVSLSAPANGRGEGGQPDP